MNRRGFLGLLGAAAATAVLDPERLLWVPGQKTFFLPPARAIQTAEAFFVGNNAFVTPQWITEEAMRMFEQNLRFTKVINRTYADGGLVGSTLTVRVPQRYRG